MLVFKLRSCAHLQTTSHALQSVHRLASQRPSSRTWPKCPLILSAFSLRCAWLEEAKLDIGTEQLLLSHMHRLPRAYASYSSLQPSGFEASAIV